MDNLSLIGDESIILTMQDIVVNAVRMEAILTSKRLVLVESEKGRIHHEDIPFETIGSAVAGENARFEPNIILSIITPTGDTRAVELIFFRRPGIQKTGERDQLVARIKEHISPSLVRATQTGMVPSGQVTVAAPNVSPETELNSRLEERPATQMPLKELPPAVSSRPHKPSHLAALLDRIPFTAIPAILVIIVAFVGGVFTYVQIQHEKPDGLSGSAIILPTITEATTNPEPIPSPIIQQSPGEQVISHPSSPPHVSIPESGVWVRIQYPGTFIGSIGARGLLRQVNTTGDQFYHILASDDIIDISIEKQDASGDLLAIEIYKDGTLVKRSTTSTPLGLIDLHVNLKS